MDTGLTDPKFVELSVTETNFSKHNIKLWVRKDLKHTVP